MQTRSHLRRRRCHRHRCGAHCVGAHRPDNVFDALLSHICERVRELVADLVTDYPRDADAARLGQCLQPRRDVDAVALDVVAVADNVAKIDPNAENDAFVPGNLCVAIDHRALQLGGAAHRVDDAGEFRQNAVAGGFDDAAAVLPDLRVDELTADALEPFERPLLVCSHQPRIGHDIGGEDCGETAFNRLFHASPSRGDHNITVILGGNEFRRKNSGDARAVEGTIGAPQGDRRRWLFLQRENSHRSTSWLLRAGHGRLPKRHGIR